MIRFITVEELLALRNELLREGRLKPDECRFPTDNVPGNFHLGYYVDDELVCIASFAPESYGKYEGIGYRLRGMATCEKYRGQGLGSQLINFAITHLRWQRVDYVWCNARKVAWHFYNSLGFEVLSTEFDIAGIGPHYEMCFKIR